MKVSTYLFVMIFGCLVATIGLLILIDLNRAKVFEHSASVLHHSQLLVDLYSQPDRAELAAGIEDAQWQLDLAAEKLAKSQADSRLTVYFGCTLLPMLIIGLGIWFNRRVSLPISNFAKQSSSLEALGARLPRLASYGPAEMKSLANQWLRLDAGHKSEISSRRKKVADLEDRQSDAELDSKAKSRIISHLANGLLYGVDSLDRSRLLQLVNYSELDMGKRKLARNSIDVEDLINHFVHYLQEHGSSGLKISISQDSFDELKLFGDRRHLLQTLIFLSIFLLQETQPQEIEIKVKHLQSVGQSERIGFYVFSRGSKVAIDLEQSLFTCLSQNIDYQSPHCLLTKARFLARLMGGDLRLASWDGTTMETSFECLLSRVGAAAAVSRRSAEGRRSNRIDNSHSEPLERRLRQRDSVGVR